MFTSELSSRFINGYSYQAWVKPQNMTRVKPSKLTSIWITILLLLFSMIIILVAFANWIHMLNKSKLYKVKTLRELFSGLKNNNRSRFVILIFFIKRLLLVMFWTILGPMSVMSKVISWSVIQILNTVYVILIRPFETWKDNIWEVIMELNFSGAISILLYYNLRPRWNQRIEDVYIYTIISAFWLWFLITFIDTLIKLVKKCCWSTKEYQTVKPKIKFTVNQADNFRTILDENDSVFRQGSNQNVSCKVLW